MIGTIDIETDGLDPTVNFITMVGTMDDHGVRVFTSPASEFRTDPYSAEKTLLQNLVSSSFKPDTLLSFNAIWFDLPFISTRLLANNLPQPALFGSKRHIDLMQFATHLNGGIRISKDMAAHKFCNVYVPKNSSGAYLAQIYNQRIVSDVQHADTIMHNVQDLHVSFQMYEAWKRFPSFEKFYSAKYPDIKEWLYAK